MKDSVGAYQLISLIGQGGMGTVWLGGAGRRTVRTPICAEVLTVARVRRDGKERFKRGEVPRARPGSELLRTKLGWHDAEAVPHTTVVGAGSTGPYGHDGRSMTINDVILRHGGEAETSRDRYADLANVDQIALQTFLNSLILFPPDDTASNLDPGNRAATGFPQFGHGASS